MNLAEAIEILTKERHDHHSFPTDIIGQAEQLGIEALKLYMTLKATGGIPRGFSGIGETEE